jgi:hypothetical protein
VDLKEEDTRKWAELVLAVETKKNAWVNESDFKSKLGFTALPRLDQHTKKQLPINNAWVNHNDDEDDEEDDGTSLDPPRFDISTLLGEYESDDNGEGKPNIKTKTSINDAQEANVKPLLTPGKNNLKKSSSIERILSASVSMHRKASEIADKPEELTEQTWEDTSNDEYEFTTDDDYGDDTRKQRKSKSTSKAKAKQQNHQSQRSNGPKRSKTKRRIIRVELPISDSNPTVTRSQQSDENTIEVPFQKENAATCSGKTILAELPKSGADVSDNSLRQEKSQTSATSSTDANTNNTIKRRGSIGLMTFPLPESDDESSSNEEDKLLQERYKSLVSAKGKLKRIQAGGSSFGQFLYLTHHPSETKSFGYTHN